MRGRVRILVGDLGGGKVIGPSAIGGKGRPRETLSSQYGPL